MLNILFIQILFVLIAIFYVVAGFGERKREYRYADNIMAVVVFVLLLLTEKWYYLGYVG